MRDDDNDYRNPHREFPLPVPVNTLRPNDALFVQQHSGMSPEEYQASIEAKRRRPRSTPSGVTRIDEQ